MPHFLLLLFAIAEAPAPPPPIIHVEQSRANSQPATAIIQPPSTRDPGRRAAIAIEANAGGRNLWSGTLRVAYPSGARVERSETQALPAKCVVPSNSYAGRQQQERNSFSLEINDISYRETGAAYSFRVNWQRPAESCAAGSVNRSVELTGNLDLTSGAVRTVQGDAGLVVTFRLVGTG